MVTAVWAVVALLSLDIIADGATISVTMSVTVSVVGSRVSVVASMVSVAKTMVSVTEVTAGSHLLTGHLSYFGLFGHSRSDKNGQNNQEFHLCSRFVDRVVSVEKLVPCTLR